MARPAQDPSQDQHLFQAMLAALRGQQSGLGIADLWPAWRDATGRSRSSLNVLLHGSYQSSLAKAAYIEVAQEAARGGPLSPIKSLSGKHQGTGKPRMGRVARLTCEAILNMRAEAATGVSVAELAKRFETSRVIAQSIVEGQYHTVAMREALSLEQQSVF